MNDIMINRETKITLLEVIKTGRCTEKQREIIANAFNLFHEQTQMNIKVMSEQDIKEVQKLING
jgi:DNA-binding MarR family transcriptional regulator